MGQRVFIVEDEADIRDILRHHLVKAGYEVASSGDGETALSILENPANQKPDLVILDLMLPGLSGFDLCRKMRSAGSSLKKTPILMLTAKSQTSDIVTGLELGADDYLIKPFEIAEVLARVKALLRRATETSVMAVLFQRGLLTVDIDKFKAWVDGQLLDLTASEFRLLQALVETDGSVLTRTQLIQKMKGGGIVVVDRTIDFHVLGLRRKLGKAGAYIETVRGVGYRLQQQINNAERS